MPAAKRKGSPSLEDDTETSKRRFAESEAAQEPAPQEDDTTTEAPAPTEEATPSETPASAATDRAARFAALRARNQTSRKENLKEARNETRRAAVDPAQLAALNRKKERVQYKMHKADVRAEGGDPDRAEAWNYTVAETESWQEREAEKARRRENASFRDFTQEAPKTYERQVGQLKKGPGGQRQWEERMEAYEGSKREEIDAAVRSGRLELVETETGEVVAVDKDGTFLSTAGGGEIGAFGHKPDEAALDRLQQDHRKAEEVRLRKNRERGIKNKNADDGGDVTYINEKNNQYNKKLGRSFDPYTAEIRANIERGTAL